jgi:hypothetical protein
MGNAIIVEPYDIPIVSAEGSAAGTSPGNLNNDWMGVVHRGTATTTGSIIFGDLGVARPVDTVALLSASTAVSNIATVAAGTSNGSFDILNTGAQAFPAGSAVPTSGRQNSLTLLGSATTARWWTVQMGTLAGAPFEAGRWVIGEKYQPARNFSFGAAFGVIDRGGGDFSQQGVWLPKSGAKQRTLGVSFSATTRQEAETILGPLLERVGNSKHVLLVTDPDANAQRQRRMYFGPFIGNLEMLWRVADGWEWRANMVSSI